jgi:hypothetical protein
MRGTRGSCCAVALCCSRRLLRFIDFASTTTEDLDLLTAACDPATFGRGKEDVYDESYRKAVKMDASKFSIQLDLAGAGLIQTIEDQLLQSGTENMHIKAELYKLNVYGNHICIPASLIVDVVELV